MSHHENCSWFTFDFFSCIRADRFAQFFIWKKRRDSSNFKHFDNTFFDPEGVDAAKVENGMRYQQGKVSATWANDKLALTGGFEGIIYKGKPEMISPFNEELAIQVEQVGKE